MIFINFIKNIFSKKFKNNNLYNELTFKIIINEILNLKNNIKCINNDIHLDREKNFFDNSIYYSNGQKVAIVVGLRHYIYLNKFFKLYKKNNNYEDIDNYINNMVYCNK